MVLPTNVQMCICSTTSTIVPHFVPRILLIHTSTTGAINFKTLKTQNGPHNLHNFLTVGFLTVLCFQDDVRVLCTKE